MSFGEVWFRKCTFVDNVRPISALLQNVLAGLGRLYLSGLARGNCIYVTKICPDTKRQRKLKRLLDIHTTKRYNKFEAS